MNESRPETTWHRIRWPEGEPLPGGGTEIAIGREKGGRTMPGRYVVISAHGDIEPGWIQVEVRQRRR